MKSFILLILAVFSLSAFADQGPVGRFATADQAGTLQGPLEQWFISCKNTSGGALVDGDAVILDVSEDDGISCTTTTTAGEIPLCVLAEACADDQVCKCQTYGLKSNVNFDATNANATAGDPVFLSENNAGQVQGDGSPAATDHKLGVFYDSASSSGDQEVFLMLR